MNINVNNVEETIKLGEKIGSLLKENDVILLSGDLGAGKTTLTKGIGKALGITRVINSPTFTIVKEYYGNMTLYHLDLYRLNSIGNDFDLEEYFNSDAVTVVEWGDNVKEILPNEYLRIDIYRTGDESRRLEISFKGSRYEKLAGEILC